jgi:hypothetical protein
VTADSTAQAKSAARDLEDSDAVHALARLGLGARSVVWLVIGLLLLSVALGGSEQTDQGGAMRAVSEQPFGTPCWSCWPSASSATGLWRLLSAAVGHRHESDPKKKWGQRALSLVKGLLYGSLGVATVRFLLDGQQPDQTQSRTAELMAAPFGRVLVGLAGVVLVGLGLAKGWKGVTEDHADELEHSRMPSGLRSPAVKVGIVGLLGRGAVFVLLGGFLVRAAVLFDPQEAKGLDAALATCRSSPTARCCSPCACSACSPTPRGPSSRRCTSGCRSFRPVSRPADQDGRASGVLGAHEHVAALTGPHLAVVGDERLDLPVGRAPSPQGRGRQRHVHGELAGQRSAEQEQPVDEQHRAGRDRLERAAGRPVPLGVPERRQVAAGG